MRVKARSKAPAKVASATAASATAAKIPTRDRSFGAAGGRTWMLAAACVMAGCVTQGRFADRPIVWEVDDQRDIPEPKELSFDRYASLLDSFVTRRSIRALELRDLEPAHNTNALDEVPNSTWFTNRIGVRTIAPAEAALGDSADGPPTLPLTVVSGKPGGANPGMVAKDRDGRRFVIKFDTQDNPEMQTAANTIVNRIFWTLGYNVPNDTIVEFARSDVGLAPDATVSDEMGQKRPMTVADVDGILATAPLSPRRTYRATASEFIRGVPKGGFAKEGVRDDDPNDVVAHEHRRELRGLRTFAAWLNHTDMKQDNTLDAYVEEDGRRFLRHYLLDFGEALGGQAAEAGRPETGYENFFDWEIQGQAAASFGLWVRPWERIEPTPWPSIGSFTSAEFDPRAWKEMFPYWPFAEADAADNYWAAKLVARFDKPLLKAIVSEGQLSQPEAAAYLVDTLYERRTKVARTYLEAVSPLDDFSIDSQKLCLVDQSIRFGIVTGGALERLGRRDTRGDMVLFHQLFDSHGSACIPVPRGDDYTVYRLRVRRGAERRQPMQVHFKAGKRPRILGIIRTER